MNKVPSSSSNTNQAYRGLSENTTLLVNLLSSLFLIASSPELLLSPSVKGCTSIALPLYLYPLLCNYSTSPSISVKNMLILVAISLKKNTIFSCLHILNVGCMQIISHTRIKQRLFFCLNQPVIFYGQQLIMLINTKFSNQISMRKCNIFSPQKYRMPQIQTQCQHLI